MDPRLHVDPRSERRRGGDSAASTALIILGALVTIFGVVMATQQHTVSRGMSLTMRSPPRQPDAPLQMVLQLDTEAERATLPDGSNMALPFHESFVSTNSAFGLDGVVGGGPVRLRLTGPSGETDLATRLLPHEELHLRFETPLRGTYVLTADAPKGSPGLKAYLGSHQPVRVWEIRGKDSLGIVVVAVLWVIAGMLAVVTGLSMRRRADPVTRGRLQLAGGSFLVLPAIAVPAALFLLNDYHLPYWRFPWGYPLLSGVALTILFAGPLIAAASFGKQEGRRATLMIGAAVGVLGGVLGTLTILLGAGVSSYAPNAPPYYGDYVGLGLHVLGLWLATPLLIAGGSLIGLGLRSSGSATAPPSLGRLLLRMGISLGAGLVLGLVAFSIVLSQEEDQDVVMAQLPAALGAGVATMIVTTAGLALLLARRASHSSPEDDVSRIC